MAKIDIKDLIGGAVENAIARREQNLTAEEAKEIQGGASLSSLSTSIVVSPTIAGGIIKFPTTCGMWCPPTQTIKIA